MHQDGTAGARGRRSAATPPRPIRDPRAGGVEPRGQCNSAQQGGGQEKSSSENPAAAGPPRPARGLPGAGEDPAEGRPEDEPQPERRADHSHALVRSSGAVISATYAWAVEMFAAMIPATARESTGPPGVAKAKIR